MVLLMSLFLFGRTIVSDIIIKLFLIVVTIVLLNN